MIKIDFSFKGYQAVGSGNSLLKKIFKEMSPPPRHKAANFKIKVIRTLELHELTVVSGGGLEYNCDYSGEGGYGGDGGEPSPSYVDAKSAAPDNPSESLKPSTDKNGNTTVTNVCITVNGGVVSQQTCLNTDNTTTVQTCVNLGAGVSGNYCSTVTSKSKKNP
ncbi:hypothetical protein [Janthinobacterium sp. LB3P118]|uniref:hypothetical protein n=1 Tax=Janthinobacterium sp. LB3P118 TaxID=3424195 RepID=UPI003F20D0C9